MGTSVVPGLKPAHENMGAGVLTQFTGHLLEQRKEGWH